MADNEFVLELHYYEYTDNTAAYRPLNNNNTRSLCHTVNPKQIKTP